MTGTDKSRRNKENPYSEPDEVTISSPSDLPLISVITINFNNASALEATLVSVQKQSYPALEHIVIDGGSNDGSLEIIEKYQEDLAYWISEPDQGIYDAINKGIDQSHGELLNILNSGDCYTESILGTVAVHYQKHAFEIALCDYIWVYPDRQLRISANPGMLKKGSAVCHQALFYQRHLHQSLGKYDLRYPLAADYHFVRRVYEKHEFLKISESACYYQLGGVSENNFLQYADEVRQISHSLHDPFWEVERTYWFKFFKFYLRRAIVKLHLTPLLFVYRRLKYSNQFTSPE
ncbi:MAG: glycosyltransferase [SAR324 cluster bacterium]|nr:glycosyltransferase [SAR324 cluster bacterium]